jgi:hypothetical protein
VEAGNQNIGWKRYASRDPNNFTTATANSRLDYDSVSIVTGVRQQETNQHGNGRRPGARVRRPMRESTAMQWGQGEWVNV